MFADQEFETVSVETLVRKVVFAKYAMSSRLLAGVALAGLAAAALPDTAIAAPVAYSCEAGVSFEIEYSARRDKAELNISGDRVLMSSAQVASGFRYQGSGYELHGQDTVALFTLPGGRTIDCRVRPQQQQVSQENAPPEPEVVGPSFDCGGELSEVEQRICASAHLSELDGKMTALYKELRKGMRKRARGKFEKEQESWLDQRNQCAAKDACILDQYYGRIAYLEEFKELGSEPEPPPVPGANAPAPASDAPAPAPSAPVPVAAGPEPAAASPAATVAKPAFPHPAQSWGGIVRAGPGTKFRRQGSLKEGDAVTLLENTGVPLNGYVWFKIKYGSRTGYQWGGILCPKGAAVEGTYKVCE